MNAHVPARQSLRWWSLLAAAGVLAFAVYISLVPFRFVPPPDGLSVWALFDARLERQIVSRTNVLANGIMFLPFGFFAAGFLVDERSAAWRWLLAGLFLLGVSVATSVAIEVLQVLVPGRTPSLADIVAQTMGTAIGITAWAVLAAEARMFAESFARGSRRAGETALIAYAAVRMYLLLEPLDLTLEFNMIPRKFRAGLLVLDPRLSPTLNLAGIPAMLGDFLLGVPIGVMAMLVGAPAGRRRSVRTALVLSTLFFCAGEAAQIFVRSRTADIVDLAVNAAGGAAGVLLTAALVEASVVDRRRRSGQLPLSLGLAAAAALYVAYNLSPFDFVISEGMVARRLPWLLNPPFYGYYQNPEFKALSDIAIKMSLGLPFGLLFLLRLRPDLSRFNRSFTVAWFVLIAGFFTGVELGQVFVPSRYPDNTDVLLALAGAWVGIRIARPFLRRPRPAFTEGSA